MRKRVFISYSSSDQEIALQVCGFLEANEIGCWYAPRDILPGEFYGERIVNGIKESEVLTVIITPNSCISTHVLREVQIAQEENKIIVPIILEGTLFPENLRYMLCIYQNISLSLQRINDATRSLMRIINAPRNPTVNRRAELKEDKLASVISSIKIHEWSEKKTLISSNRSSALQEITLLQNLLAGVESARERNDASSAQSLIGFIDMMIFIYAICVARGTNEAKNELNGFGYQDLNVSWRAYDSEDHDELEKFYEKNELARRIVSEAQLNMLNGNELERSYAEGCMRGLFCVARFAKG
jgi:hypothetical protein